MVESLKEQEVSRRYQSYCDALRNFKNTALWEYDREILEIIRKMIAKMLNSDNGGNVGRTKIKERIALKDFIKKYCDLSEKPDIDSKCEMLMREHRKNQIKLPLVKHEYRQGQRKLYYLEKLIKNWPDYRMMLTTLPPLKKSDDK